MTRGALHAQTAGSEVVQGSSAVRWSKGAATGVKPWAGSGGGCRTRGQQVLPAQLLPHGQRSAHGYGWEHRHRWAWNEGLTTPDSFTYAVRQYVTLSAF